MSWSVSPATVSFAITRIRRSSSGWLSVGATRGGGSSRPRRNATYTTTTVSTTKTPRPTHLSITAPMTISAKYAIVSRRNRNASASLRSGFLTSSPFLPRSEDVNRCVNDDPHDVDEVPVDAAQLDAVVVRSREVAAEGAGRHEEQDRQTDEDVRTVEPGQTEEDRRE